MALPVLLLMTPGLLMVSSVGAVCVGSRQALRVDEALVMCPLTEDVRQTQHSVIISHFVNTGQKRDSVLGCDILPDQPQNAHCVSASNFTLVFLGNDCVMARAPRTQLQDGSYKCQLVPPPDEDHPFTACVVFTYDDAEDPLTTISAVTPSTVTDQLKPRGQTTKIPTSVSADDRVFFFQFVLLFMLTIVTVLLLTFTVLLYKQRLHTKHQDNEESLLSACLHGPRTPVMPKQSRQTQSDQFRGEKPEYESFDHHCIELIQRELLLAMPSRELGSGESFNGKPEGESAVHDSIKRNLYASVHNTMNTGVPGNGRGDDGISTEHHHYGKRSPSGRLFNHDRTSGDLHEASV